MTKELNSWIRFILVAALLAGADLFLHSRGQAESLPPRLELSAFPVKVGDWVGMNLEIGQDVREVLGDGDFLVRDYRRNPSEPPVDLFIAYFQTQRTGSTIHSPQNCLPGSGWIPVENSRFQLRRPGRKPVTVNRYVIAKGLQRQLVLYWYQSHGRVVASEYWAKIYLVADSIRMNRSDGALVRIITMPAPAESLESAQARAVAFAQSVTHLLDMYIPR